MNAIVVLQQHLSGKISRGEAHRALADDGRFSYDEMMRMLDRPEEALVEFQRILELMLGMLQALSDEPDLEPEERRTAKELLARFSEVPPAWPN